METLLALTGMAVVLFASTNIDDMFLLVGFFSDPNFRVRDIVLGQYAGIAALFCMSLAASLLALMIPVAYFGLLGVIPILIGGKKLFALFRKDASTEEGLEHSPNARGSGRVTTVAMVTMANGGDNIGIYTPSLAIRSAFEIAEIALVFAVMIALWCFVAHALVNHPRFGSPIRRYAKWITPIAFIGLGVIILYEAGSFGLLRHGGL